MFQTFRIGKTSKGLLSPYFDLNLPYRECGREVQIKHYGKHALDSKCCINLENIEDYDYCPAHGMSLPFVLTRRLDSKGPIQGPVFNTTGDGHWYLMLFHVRGVPFYMAFSFSAARQSFIICVIIPDTVDVARKYIAQIWLEESDKPNPERQDFDQRALSIEEVFDYDQELPPSHYLILPYGEVKKFFTYSTNEGFDVWPDEEGLTTVCLPVQVKDVVAG